MRSFTKTTLATLGVLTLAAPAAAQFGGPPAPPNTGVPLFAHLAGGEGAGNVTVVVDPPKGTACYILNVAGLANVTMAHIHKGAAGETGAVVVPFEKPEGGTSGGCAQVTAEVSAALLADPGGYYVNVHTQAFPSGAIRGQLNK